MSSRLHNTNLPLTKREHEIVEQLCLGLSNKLIAYNLGLAPDTVKLYVHLIMRKLKVDNRTQVVLKMMVPEPEAIIWAS